MRNNRQLKIKKGNETEKNLAKGQITVFVRTAIHGNGVIHRHVITLIAIVNECEGTRSIIKEQELKIRKQGQEMRIM